MTIATGFSLPPLEEQKETVRQLFNDLDMLFDDGRLFKSRGPDIVATSDSGLWRIECKGLAPAKPQTHRNNFDRALASVVSYYRTPRTHPGLALAADYLWEYSFSDRLPRALREALNLWVFLVSDRGAHAFEPTEELPYPGAHD